MPISISSKIKSILVNSRKPRLFIDASSFDPTKAKGFDQAVLIVSHDGEDTICERVRQELKGAAGVVVLDLDSNDATPFLAAEAGAVVVLQEKGISKEDAFCKALKVAHRFSAHVTVIEMDNIDLDKEPVINK